MIGPEKVLKTSVLVTQLSNHFCIICLDAIFGLFVYSFFEFSVFLLILDHLFGCAFWVIGDLKDMLPIVEIAQTQKRWIRRSFGHDCLRAPDVETLRLYPEVCFVNVINKSPFSDAAHPHHKWQQQLNQTICHLPTPAHHVEKYCMVDITFTARLARMASLHSR